MPVPMPGLFQVQGPHMVTEVHSTGLLISVPAVFVFLVIFTPFGFPFLLVRSAVPLYECTMFHAHVLVFSWKLYIFKLGLNSYNKKPKIAVIKTRYKFISFLCKINPKEAVRSGLVAIGFYQGPGLLPAFR